MSSFLHFKIKDEGAIEFKGQDVSILYGQFEFTHKHVSEI